MKDTFVDNIGHDRQVMFQKYSTDEEGIELLLKLMEKEPLAPRLEHMMGYTPDWLQPDSAHARERQGVKSYCGNFHRVSCSFNIDTRDPKLIARLDEAIERNRATPEYQEAKAEWLEGERRRQEQARQRIEKSMREWRGR
jgi:hypothetical protein